jgi:ketosteroid isomerase-like protein
MRAGVAPDSPDVPPARSLALIEAVAEAFDGGDWEALRALYHDDALLCTMAAHERIVGPDELIEIFKALDTTTYQIGDTDTEAIDDHAVIVSGPLRYPQESGDTAYAAKSWVLTFKDELVYRSNSYPSPERARTAYVQHGIDLGMSQGELEHDGT